MNKKLYPLGWSFIDPEKRYAETQDKNQLYIEFYNSESHDQADITMEWINLQKESVPMLKIFNDSWLTIYKHGQEFMRLLASMDDQNISKQELKQKLLEIGFIDETYKK